MIWIRYEGRRQWSQTNLPLTESENQLADCIERQAAEVDRLTAENERYRKAQAEALEYPANMQRLEELQATNERLQKLNACVTHLMQHPDDDDAYQRIAEAWLACNPNAQEDL